MNDNDIQSLTESVYMQADYYSAPQSLSQHLLRIAKQLFPHKSEQTLLEEIEENEENIHSVLLKKVQDLRKEGMFCRYSLSIDSDEIAGFSYPFESDSSTIKRVKAVAPAVEDMLKSIRELNPEDFEQLCKRILDLLHATETKRTPYSNDGGVDFLGWLHIPQTLVSIEEYPMFQQDFRMLVLGQAKRYKPDNPIGVKYVREMVGTVASFHHDQMAPWESRLPLKGITVVSPILPIIITTGKISRDARKLAKQCGVLTKDGADLALFLCLEDIGVEYNSNNPDNIVKIEFKSELFEAWLFAPENLLDR